ncbi:MAG: hypothetical protein OEL91_09060, partial [Burkholderiaceae bacterium]|nr:hypothetical protein [Burkholderiaceae bacterium]
MFMLGKLSDVESSLNDSPENFAIVLYPTARASAIRVTVSPMDNATFFVPLVDAAEGNDITLVQRCNPRREIDVVRDQHGLARVQANDEALVTAAVAVIRQELFNRPLAF